MIYFTCWILLRLFLKTLFWREIYGRRNLPKGAALIACNHQSYLDPPIVGSAAPGKIVYLARRSLVKNRLGKWLFDQMNVILVTRGEPELSAFKKILHRLKRGEKVLIFPEGTRSQTGELMPPQKGIGMLVAKAQVPVVPVYVYGTRRAMPPGRSLIFPAKIIVVFGEPIYFDKMLNKVDKKQLYSQIGKVVMADIAKLREFCLTRL